MAGLWGTMTNSLYMTSIYLLVLKVLEEIEDRRQFLEEMTSLGMGPRYQHIINTEISQVTHCCTLTR